MVTVNNMLGENSGTGEFEFKGLSTDEKPTGTFGVKNIGENSLFLELDTGKTYYYSEGSWSEVSMGSSGSGGGASLPAVTTSDEGKVLKVNSSGKWAAGTDETGDALPTYGSGDNGKVLKVNSGGTGVEWGTDATGDTLPSYNSGDNGKVLKVNSGGTGVEWATPTAANANDFPVIITDSSGTYVASDRNGDPVTIAQINTAAAAGKNVYAETEIIPGEFIRMPLTGYGSVVVCFGAQVANWNGNEFEQAEFVLYGTSITQGDVTTDTWDVIG